MTHKIRSRFVRGVVLPFIASFRHVMRTAMGLGKEQMEERIKMITNKKKKPIVIGLSLALIIVFTLFLVFTSATNMYVKAEILPSNESYTESTILNLLETIAQSIQMNGTEVANWPLESKKVLYRILSSVVKPDEQVTPLSDETSLDQVFVPFTVKGNISLTSVMSALYPKFEDTPYTVKAHYGQLQRKYFNGDEEGFLFPEQTEVQEKDAIAAAKALLPQISKLTSLDVGTLVANTAFLTNEEYGRRVWLVHLLQTEYTDDYYIVIDGSTGKVLKYTMPNSGWIIPEQSTLEGIPSGAKCIQPSALDADEQSILQQTRDLCAQTFRMQKDAVNQLNISTYLLYHEKYNLGFEPVWISICNSKSGMYRFLFAYNGSLIDTAIGNEEFSIRMRIEPAPGDMEWPNGLIDEKGRTFSDWTIESKAELTKKWKPIIDQYLLVNPYYKNWNKSLYRATRFVYDLPNQGEISLDHARDITLKELSQLGAPTTSLYTRVFYVYFDRTDSSKPLWKFVFPSDSADVLQYKVQINAVSGEVESSIQIPTQMFMDIDN